MASQPTVVHEEDPLPEDDDGWELVPAETSHNQDLQRRRWMRIDLTVTVLGRRYRYTRDTDYEASADSNHKSSREPLPQIQSPLFQLPTEIRLGIYETVLQVPADRMGLCLTRGGSRPSVLALLETCRRALAEAEQIFYAINKFRLGAETDHFLSSLGPRRSGSIVAMTVSCKDGQSVLDALKLLQRAPHLRHLTVDVQMSIRYMRLSSWTLFKRELAEGVENLTELRELDVVTPSMDNWTEAELQRKCRLDEEVIARMQDAVGKKRRTAARSECPMD